MDQRVRINEDIHECYSALLSLADVPERNDEYLALLEEIAKLQRLAAQAWRQRLTEVHLQQPA